MNDILLKVNGEPWMTDDGRTVPRVCPKCGNDMGLFLEGEPIFRCKGEDKHFFGTLAFKAPPEEDE